jgi:hypothetical protein
MDQPSQWISSGVTPARHTRLKSEFSPPANVFVDRRLTNVLRKLLHTRIIPHDLIAVHQLLDGDLRLDALF